MKRILAISLAVAAMAVQGAVKVGDNVLANPIFESDQLDVPGCWNMTDGKEVYVWSANGGPKACPAVTFDASRAEGGTAFSMRQGGFRLLPGGRYRLSGWVRANGFRAKKAGVLVINTGWQWSAGIRFEACSGGWRRLCEEFVAEPSRGDCWTLILFADDFSGRIEFADLLLTPVDDRTAAGTRLSDKAEAVESPRLVPMEPLLQAIPSSNPAVVFRFFGRLDGGVESDYDVRIEAEGEASSERLVRDRTVVRLPRKAASGEMTASVVRRKDGAVLFSRRFPYRIVDTPRNVTSGVRLNGLVEEYVRRRLKQGGSDSLKLAFDRNVWLFVSAAARKVAFDGREIIGGGVPGHEAFVEASPGEHRLSVFGATGGEMIVRRIPEILVYQIGAQDFREYGCRSLTTMNCGGVGPSEQAWFRKTGHLWIGNVQTGGLKDAADLARTIDGSRYAADLRYDGVACDEQGPWKAKMMSDFAEGLWSYRGRPGFRVYSWVVGKPYYVASNADLLSATVNMSGGRGRFMNEIYCIAKPTEEEARAAARDWMVGNYRAWRDLVPVASWGYAPIFGAFVRMGGWTLCPYPDVDFRYFLDLVFNVLVNDPDMVDVPMAGIWGSNYSGPELKRWTCRLLRHYLIEGKRTMLSAEHGLRYHPGHISDGDFASGAAKWRTRGNVRFDRIKGFGDECEFRGAREKLEIGDTFAVLRRKGGIAAELSQKATGLVPGRRYLIDLRSFFPGDVRARNQSDRKTGLSVRVSGGEIDAARSRTHVFKRGERAKKAAQTNWHEIVFVAKSQEAEITLSTADSPDEEDIGVNCVGVFVVLD